MTRDLRMCTGCRGDEVQCRCASGARNWVTAIQFRQWRRDRRENPDALPPKGEHGMSEAKWCLECGHRSDWCACDEPDHVTAAEFGAARARAMTVLSRSPRTGVDA